MSHIQAKACANLSHIQVEWLSWQHVTSKTIRFSKTPKNCTTLVSKNSTPSDKMVRRTFSCTINDNFSPTTFRRRPINLNELQPENLLRTENSSMDDCIWFLERFPVKEVEAIIMLIVVLTEMVLFLNLTLFLQNQLTQSVFIIAALRTSISCKLQDLLQIKGLKTKKRHPLSH